MNKIPQKLINNCHIGEGTKIHNFVNLYDCQVGENCLIGTFVEIQGGVVVGDNVKVESHSFICEGVIVEDNVFIGHHVVFTNDRYPRSINSEGKLKKETDWKLEKTVVRKNAAIGSNATILPGIIIGESAIIGAGAVVTKNVAAYSIVAGNPAKEIRKSQAKTKINQIDKRRDN